MCQHIRLRFQQTHRHVLTLARSTRATNRATHAEHRVPIEADQSRPEAVTFDESVSKPTPNGSGIDPVPQGYLVDGWM